ncbi:MAG: YihY/virulence factor BrkB family protein, partial [Lachnospiraceae bacterium]|nr:YihY/virulence factor BrkB family protein [Lachnospiraceae bacterium]
LISVFLFIYKFLPNCHYTFRSQFPGALLVATIWMFFSYLISLYYHHNRNFSNIYGSLTGLILAMIWMYFCCYFLYFGAELNRIIYEDPEDNMIVNMIDGMKDASLRKEQIIEEELDEHSVWKPIRAEEEAEIPSEQPDDINIPWADEGFIPSAPGRRKDDDSYDFYRSLRHKSK